MALYRVVRRVLEEIYIEADHADAAAQEAWTYGPNDWYAYDTEIAAVELEEEDATDC